MATPRLLQQTSDLLLEENGDALLLDGPVPIVIPPPVITSTLAETLVTHHKPISRVTLLSPDLITPLAVLTPLDGSAVWNRTRNVPRSATFPVADPDGTLTDELLVEERPVLIERGAYVNAVPQLSPLVMGRITEVGTELASGAVNVTVESRLSLLDRPFALQTTFPAGMRLRDIARQVAESSGFGTDDARYDLDDGEAELVVARTYDTGDNELASLIALFNDNGLDLWDTGAGVMTTRPTPDPLSAEIAWSFEPGTIVLKHSRKRSAHQAAVNRVRVTGRGPDGYPLYAEVKITDPAHPLFWTSTLDLPLLVDRPEVGSVEACLAVATQLLIDGSSVTESHGLDAFPIPPLMSSGRPVVAVGADRLRLDSITMPLRKGGMSFSAQTVRAIS